ncbi:hypothetical protein ACFSJW_02305 [Flavobacterium artemisiae]|uniref:Lipoprotein n=1 Tax=Flavobacterium artemisiae TaxID=2126556 RepID=A0ABW4HJ88_9FLAO
MKKFTLLSMIIILISLLNYGCEHLCEDENSSQSHVEASLHKTDTLNLSKID